MVSTFTRTLVPVYPAELIGDEAWLRTEKQMNYLLVKNSNDYPHSLPAGLLKVEQEGSWIVYKWPDQQ